MGFWTGAIIGLFVGAMIGVLALGLVAGGAKRGVKDEDCFKWDQQKSDGE